MKQIKDEIYDSTAEITVLWIPSHCKVEGNDKADDLARLGSETDQSGTPVIHKIHSLFSISNSKISNLGRFSPKT